MNLILLVLIALYAGMAKAKNIAIYIDGTGNHPEMADSTKGKANTNIRRMFCLTAENADQIPIYHSGVGTTGWAIWDQKGELYGLGGDIKKRNTYRDLLKNYSQGDQIYIFGFSRGAAIARDLANHIVDKGINGSHNITIRMVGLFDTVGAFGVPLDIFGLPFQEMNIGKKLDLPDNVQNAYHAVALDEDREAFIPTLLYTQDPKRFEEVWFPGVHTDIGGGYVHRGIADITLQYMIDRAKENGLTFTTQSHCTEDESQLTFDQKTVRDTIGKQSPGPHSKRNVYRKIKVQGMRKPLATRSGVKLFQSVDGGAWKFYVID